MGLREDITNAMTETYNTRLNNIADMVGRSEDEIREKMKNLDFRDYVDLMRALRDFDKDTAKEILGLVDEAYSTGSQGSGGSMSPGEMKAQKQQSPAAKAQAMQRLGRDNLGGATAAQAADALSKAGEGKPLTPIQRKAMASQASSVDALASDPRTASQFRNLLNKLNRK
jgi:predicted ArsR family transcriptional regulator